MTIFYTSITFILILITTVAIIRFVLAKIYVAGNRNDELLLELMGRNRIFNWKELQQKSGLSSSAMWKLRDSDGTLLSLDELNNVAIALNIPLGHFLDKL